MAEIDPDQSNQASDSDVPIEQTPMEVEEQPRRAASAEFEVDTEIGSQAALREAMDPANQSLADALRLSFRVLQAVIVVLVAMFLISGVKIVKQGQSGVMLRFGAVVTVDGEEALAEGRIWNLLPYPAGDFVIFNRTQSIDLGDAFWPAIPPSLTLEQAIDGARTSAALIPGRDGSLLTRDGDLAHLRLTAEYEIANPVKFVKRLSLADAERVVHLVLKRAAIEVAAGLSLQELVERSQDTRNSIRLKGQRMLDNIHSGIELVGVQLADAKPPLAIVKAFGDFQNAREEARQRVAQARTEAERTLNGIASNYRVLARLIGSYEEAMELTDPKAAGELLDQINDRLDGEDITGELSEIIYYAKAYESQIESSLGNEVSRFRSVLPAYRLHPELVTKKRWLAAYTYVMGREDTEIFYVPARLGSLDIRIRSLEDIQKLRQRLRLDRRQQEVFKESLKGLRRYVQRAGEFEPGQAQTLLEAGRDGTVRPRGSGR
ncbi:MAG: hypothetical protein IH888_06460 [Planctomycetes bacterium]|nr:hypothetical protein [Planctomycetota bacterium]